MKRKIMQLVEEYKNDIRNDKINLTLGVYMDKRGISPIFNTVKDAEQYLIDTESTKAKFNILGSDEFRFQAKKLLFPKFSIEQLQKVLLIQTIGSSGALSIIGEIISKKTPQSKIWLSDPTWENHEPIFSNNIENICMYRYSTINEMLNVDYIMEDLSNASEGDVVLFHACCHNPTGIICQNDQWTQLAKFCKEKKLLPLFDFAYQGFQNSIIEDTEVLNIFNNYVEEFIVCSSFSKNMGLYDDRIGTLSLVFTDNLKILNWEKELKKAIRSRYSIPPAHGSLIATTILSNEELRLKWITELQLAKEDIASKRKKVMKNLEELGILEKFIENKNQTGMFIYISVSEKQVDFLRDEYGIYMLDTGRISIASIDENKIDVFCNALKKIENL